MIESSERLTFAPYNLAYPKLDEHVGNTGFNVEENKWDMIFDFTGTDGAGEKVVHHQMMSPDDFGPLEQTVEGMDELPVNPFPLPQKYGGSAKDNDLSKQGEADVFDIRNTTAAQAQQIYEDGQQRQEDDPTGQPQDTHDGGFGDDDGNNQDDGKSAHSAHEPVKFCLYNFNWYLLDEIAEEYQHHSWIANTVRCHSHTSRILYIMSIAAPFANCKFDTL